MAEQLDTRGAVDAYLKDPIPAPSPGQGARLGIALAAGANPDYEAELKKVAQRTGVPIDTVRAYPDEMKRKAQLDALDFDTLAKQFPNTSAFLANVENAKLAHDDVDNLTGIERTVGGTIKDVGVTTLKGVVGLPQAFVGLADLVSGGYAGKGLESIGVRFNETQDILSQMYSPAQQAANRKVQEAQGFFDTIGAALENPSTIATSAWESAPQMLGGAGIARGALRFLPGLSGVVAGAIGEGAISAGSAAEQIRANSKDGLLTGKQALSATASGLGTGTLSFVGGKLAQKLGIGDIDTALATGTLTPKAVDTAHKGFVRKLAESAVTEGLFEELPQSAQEQIWQNFAEDKPIMEGVGNAAAMGFIAGAATGSSFSGVQHIAERRIARAQQAEKTAQAVQQLDTLAAESKLRQRDPATFEQFIAQATKDGPVPDVYISAQALMQSGKAAELAQVSPSIAEQLDAAAATGGDVRIPVAEYAARIAGTELNQGLLDHVKVEPNGMTKAEAQEYLQTQVQQLEQDIQRTLGEQQNDAQFKEQAKAVSDQVKAQLDQTGRFTGQVNDTYASLVGNAFAAMASRLGMTAQELYAKYPQRVVGENVAGGGVLNQITPAQAMATNVPLELPSDPVFTQAVGNTPGAQITENGLLIDLVRYQKPEQEGERAIRTGVFYLPNGAATARHYKNKGDLSSGNEYGGTEEFKGETLLRKPMFVKGATGGKAPEVAFDTLKGKGAYQKMRTDVVNATTGWGNDDAQKIENVQEMLSRYGANPALAYDIVSVSKKGNLLPYAVQENIVAHAVREAGYDAVVGYSAKKTGPTISEVFDVREQTFPSRVMRSQVHSAYMQSAYTAYTIEVDGKTRPTTNSKGQPLAQTEEGLRNFWRWFGDSKVVDAEGKPLVVYHGTPNASFDTFYPDQFFTADAAYANKFTTSSSASSSFYGGEDKAPAVYPVYLAISKPFDTRLPAHKKIYNEKFFNKFGNGAELTETGLPDWVEARDLVEFLKEEMPDAGFDGVYVDEGKDAAGQRPMAYMPFAPEQIKSAIGNTGVFDPGNPNILFQSGTADTIDLYHGSSEVVSAIKNSGTFGGIFVGTRDAAASHGDVLHRVNLREDEILTQQYIDNEADSDAVKKIITDNMPDMSDDEYDAVYEVIAEDRSVWKIDLPEERILELFRSEDMGAASWEAQRLRGILAKKLGFKAVEMDDEHGTTYLVLPGVQISPVNDVLNQDARGSFDPATNTISLLKNADLSTYLHELGHFFLEMQFDIAARDGAPDAVVKDSDVLLKWFGVPDMKTWYNLDFEARRAYHEKFAQGFEKYLFEGKAPSLDMQGLFQRFRSWLLRVYRDIKNLNVELTDEVRGVMDRMLATDEQIKVAEQARSMMPLFTSPEQAGLTPEEFQAYQSLGAEATESAQRDLQARGLRDMQWLHNARGREIKKLQAAAKARREDVRSRVRVEVMGQPVYQAWEFLTRKGTDENPASKLDSAAVKALGLPETTTKRLRDFKMIAAEGGLSPDVVAERFGFKSGDHLIQSLANAEKPADAVEALTDARMIEQYGDLASPEAIEQAADQAIHNDARSRFVATELNALNTAVGQRKVLASAAREFAQRMVSRIMLRNLRPSQYASAEARAAKAADKAFKSGDIATAATEKRNQLVNNYATKAAHQAQDDIESGVRYLKKFDKDSVRKNLDAEYLSQIDNLVEKYDLRQQSMRDADKAVSLRTWVQSQLKAGNLPDIAESLLSKQERAAYLAEVQSRDADGELVYADDEDRIRLLADAIDRSAKRPYKDMTVEEFQGLVDTVKQIEHLGRLKHKILTARDQQAYEQVRDSIAGSIVGNAKSGGKNTRTSSAWLGKKLEAIKQFGASHIKVATWARVMDGGKDNGPVWRYVVQPANERASMETTMRAEATEKLSGILDPILKKVPIADKMGKGKYFPSIGDSLNWQERFAMALNVGNESNLQRLLDGKGWTMQQIKPVLDTLTAEEWNAAQAVWDHFETYRPKIAEKELRVSGKEPEWIPARAIDVETSDGQTLKLRGGYFPVVFDPRVNLKASQHSAAEDAKNLLKASYSAATTQRSFTKARVDEVVGRPLLLNLQGLYSGVNDVIHDLAWHEWVIDANKLLRSKTIDSAIREHYGPEVKKEFERWRDDIVAGSRRLDHAIERAAGWARQSVSASALTFNVMSAAMQPLGLSNSMARIGISWVGKGLSRYISSPIDATKEAQAKSEWMANRTRTRFRELNELRNQVQGQTAPKELMGRYGYWMMMQAQMMVDVPTWWGAYEKAIAGGHDEQTAVNLADQAVKDSQGGGEEVDQSGVERGGPLIKLFTAFYGFMGTTLNTAYLAAKTDTSKAKLAADMALVLMVPAVFGALLKDALTPGDSGDDDPEKLAKKLAAEQATFLLGLVAFGREFSLAVKSLFGEAKGQSYSGPAGLRVIADTGKLAQQAQQGEFDTGFRKSFVTVLGDLSGIPAVQVNRTITGAEALAEDKTANPAALVFGFQEPH